MKRYLGALSILVVPLFLAALRIGLAQQQQHKQQPQQENCDLICIGRTRFACNLVLPHEGEDEDAVRVLREKKAAEDALRGSLRGGSLLESVLDVLRRVRWQRTRRQVIPMCGDAAAHRTELVGGASRHERLVAIGIGAAAVRAGGCASF